MMLKTDDGAHILMEMKAVLDIDSSAEEKLMNGEHVSPDEYYFKGIVNFRTGDERYKWLERKVCVCIFRDRELGNAWIRRYILFKWI
ncbi:MAG: DUF3237 family protein [Clostridia bacterium]